MKRHLRHLRDPHPPVGAGDREIAPFGADIEGDVGGCGFEKCAAKRLPRSITSSDAARNALPPTIMLRDA